MECYLGGEGLDANVIWDEIFCLQLGELKEEVGKGICFACALSQPTRFEDGSIYPLANVG